MRTNSQREKKKRKKKVRKRKAREKEKNISRRDRRGSFAEKSSKKKTRLGKEALRGFRSQIRFFASQKRLWNEMKKMSLETLACALKTQHGSCSVVSPTVLNHHHHHHHHLTRRGGREREEAIRWRDKKRERSSCVFVLRVCARSLLSRLSLIISRCCNSAEEAQHRGNEDTESFGNS